MSAPHERHDRLADVVPLHRTDPDHRTRMDYLGLVEALNDALQVIDDLERLTVGQLLVPADHVDFTARRVRQLVRSCRNEAQRRSIP